MNVAPIWHITSSGQFANGKLLSELKHSISNEQTLNGAIPKFISLFGYIFVQSVCILYVHSDSSSSIIS